MPMNFNEKSSVKAIEKQQCKAAVTPKDITVVVCVRCHKQNPWVLERIRLMGRYYSPSPCFLVVDFGSDEDFATQIAAICKEEHYQYLYVPDFETYSPAAAHNRGFEATDTEFVFFCDADFFSFRDVFARLADVATSLRMRDVVDIVLNFPAYHLNEADSREFLDQTSSEEQSNALHRIAFKANFLAYDKDDNFFVAPYSNVYLINRHLYSLSGGYDERFRGHGSEDFEFLIRLAMHVGHLPIPTDVREDLYGPMKSDFFTHKPYSGFRRLLELSSQPAVNLGFKIFHLWHPREKSIDWYANNDWKRNRFNEAIDVYAKAPHKLLMLDFIRREKKIACLCKHHEQWGYFTPFRVAGYQTIPFFDDSGDAISTISRQIISGDLDGIAIFNPYMKSHARYYETVLLARQLDRKVIVIERGALPSTIYYDTDVAYAASTYSEDDFFEEEYTVEEIASADAYVHSLREGNKTLEAMESYEVTKSNRIALSSLTSPVCFVPLQLEDDMAVTMFTKGEQTYQSFLHGLPDLIDAYPNITFVVKPHPLSKVDVLSPKQNLIIVGIQDNIHYLIDASDVVLCYNSGVGLLSILHQKPTITLGNAFYNVRGAGYRAMSATDGIEAFQSGRIPHVSSALVVRLAAWFIHRKYSEFTATDNIQEFSTRKAHGYKDILVTKFRLDGASYRLDRIKRHAPFSWNSYAAANISAHNKHAAPAMKNVETSPCVLTKWAKADFREKNFSKSAELFERAYAFDRNNPKHLRCAAEAYWRAGMKSEAKAALEKAIAMIPKNKNARLRMWTMMFPFLGYIIGDHQMKVE